jgi:hypothetical protein
MHMCGPGLTTTKYNGKSKKGPNTAAARKSKAKHEAWLREQGLHPEQLELRRAFKGQHRNELPNLSVNNPIPLGNNIAVNGGYRNGVLDNLHKETEVVRQQILDKANCVEMAYNKGPLMYHSPGTDRSQLGSKSRRG